MSFVVGNYCYGGNQYAAEILREDLHFNGITLKLCHEYPNADFPYNPDTIYEFIDSCDAIILPGRTRLQPCKSVNRLALAWSRKKPVVIPPLDAYMKYARDKENCLIAENHEDFINSLITLRDDDELRNKIAGKGYSVAVTALNPHKQIDTLIHELQQVEMGDPWAPDTFLQIIVPHYADRLDYLTLCVKTAVESEGPPRAVVVVSSSRQNPAEALAKYDNVRVIHSDRRLSFSEANNVGLKNHHPKTTHFLLLNDDTVMHPKGLRGYFEVLKNQNFILNPYSNCDKGWLHNDQITTSTGKDLHPDMTLEEFTPKDLGSLLTLDWEKDKELRESDFCAFYATLIPKAITDRVGLLNRAFLNGSEDLDYCNRAKNLLGAKCYWTKNAFVYHFGGKTRKFSEDENYERHHAEDRYNHKLIKKRWPSGKKRIGIWSGPCWTTWDLTTYKTEGLGGSETCAGRLAEMFAREGHYVTLYGQFNDVYEQFGVELIPWQYFTPEEEAFDLFIASRNLEPINENLKAKTKLVIVHDIWLLSGQHVSDYHRSVVDKFVTLSPWHYNFVKEYHSLPDNKLTIIPNGVNVELFNKLDLSSKEYGRMLFSSSPDRGLDNLLYCLPFVKEQVPEIHLHVCYGFDTWISMAESRNDVNQLKQIEQLQKAIDDAKDFVTYHGKISQKELAKMWAKTYVWGYASTFTETFCLSAKEAQLSATPMVTSNVAALETTVGDHGIRIHHHPYSREGRMEFVQQLISLHKDRDYWNSWSKKSFEGAQGVSWGDVFNTYWKPFL